MILEAYPKTIRDNVNRKGHVNNDGKAKGERILESVSGWISKHQELTKIITIVVLAIGAFLMVAGTMIAVTGMVGLVITKTAGFVGGFATMLKGIPDLLTTVIKLVWLTRTAT